MLHAEAYVDEHTYFHKGRIFWLGMQYQTYMCSAWCVCLSLPLEKKAVFEKVFSDWFYRQLTLSLEKGALEIQREVDRFGGFLENSRPLDEPPFVCLYFRGRLYTFGDTTDKVYVWGKHGGLCLGRLQEGAVTQSLQDIFQQQKTESLEEMANMLKNDMLSALQQGMLKQGYFLLWEDSDAV